LIIIDASLPEDQILALLRQITAEQPLVRCLVMAEASRQQTLFLAQGVDAAILRRAPPNGWWRGQITLAFGQVADEKGGLIDRLML
jgi:DNA-binding NarL/FixJ family response regulator